MEHTKITIMKTVEDIYNLSHSEMAKLHRFAPSDHIYFDKRYPYYRIFEQRFKELGGMTPKVSKLIGLG